MLGEKKPMLHDDWGPALDDPQGPALDDPKGPLRPASGASPMGPKAHPQPPATYLCPLGEDPVYLAALQQAASASGSSACSPAPATLPRPHDSAPAPSSSSGGSAKRANKGARAATPLFTSALAAANQSAAAAAAAASTKGAFCVPSASHVGGSGEAVGTGSVPGVGATASKPAHERVGRGRVGAKQQAAAAVAAAAEASALLPEGVRAEQGAQGVQRGGRNEAKLPAVAAGLGKGSQQQQQQQQQRSVDSAKKVEKSGRFPEHLPQEQLQIMFKRGLAFRGRLRVNAGDRREAYLTIPGLPHDCLLRGERAQNRALEGDEVAVQLLPVSAWYKNFSKFPSGVNPNEFGIQDDVPWRDAQSPGQALAAVAAAVKVAPPGALRICGQVVSILELSPKREQLVGIIQAGPSGQTAGGSPLHFFLPLAPTMPRCIVAATSVRELPEELKAEAACPAEDDAASRTLMSARVVSWGITNDAPMVELRRSLGQAGEIESETAAILEIEGVRQGDFGPEVEACLPPIPWVGITEEDLKHRRDFRSARVFSIDPPTAKDLDDAMHVEPVEGVPGRWRVGVHIADVSHFVPPDSALDNEACERATSVYLVQRVIPMLPRLLCEELCSLNPGTPRFAFSVEWEMDEEGRIYSQWAGKSVICSTAKLAYPMVQAMLEGRFNPSECSAQLYGDQPWEKVIQDCLTLHKIAQALRAARFAAGAVRLDNVRVAFGLDKDGNPVSCGQYVQQDANKLVEEFMLLTNISVAKIISAAFPDRALLRNHVHPEQSKMDSLLKLCQEQNIPMDHSSSGALQASLNALRETCQDQGIIDVVTMMATKPMQLAKYFCTGDFPDPDDWRHYALALPEYTHFTSPIRRYPDLVVHRLLSAAIDMQLQQQQQQHCAVSTNAIAEKHALMDTPRTTFVAEHCNEKRLTARNAQDASLKLYLCCLLRRAPVVTEAIVTNVGGNRFFDVYLTSYGMSTRIQVEHLGVDLDSHWSESTRTLTLQIKSSRSGKGGGGGSGRGAGGPCGGVAGVLGRRPGFGRGGQADKKTGQDGQRAVVDYGTWLEALPALSNPMSLSPVSFPLTVKLFEHLPVIVTSPLHPGKISQIVCRLLLPSAASEPPPPPPDVQPLVLSELSEAPLEAASPAAAAAMTANAAAGCPAVPEAVAAAAEQQAAGSFCIPYADLFND